MRNSASLDSTAKMKKTKRYTALGIFGLFAFFFALMYGLVIYLLHSHHFDEIVLIPFPPREAEYKNGALADGIEATEETFKAADGSILHGWYFHKPGNKLTVLFHHGNAANIAYRVFIASELMKTDIDVFLYDYRGFGKSTGTPEVKALSSDGLMAYDHLTNQLHVAPTSIINYGESIGTGVACHIASQRPSAGLILQSAIGSSENGSSSFQLREIGAPASSHPRLSAA